MNAMQQHMIDSYRASVLGTPPPPQPGVHDWQVARELGAEMARGPGLLRTLRARLHTAERPRARNG
ncbi:hypothetical protein [Streptomyces sp. NBC_00306]|uniref:hypothetical protein n=1 Tax=Streptomyces sp. NBC_00306 TaxID=2975708 RepID=UPI002E29EAC8|nr:hypothetical protein [Streptomyces sp. NBC_00306]